MGATILGTFSALVFLPIALILLAEHYSRNLGLGKALKLPNLSSSPRVIPGSSQLGHDFDETLADAVDNLNSKKSASIDQSIANWTNRDGEVVSVRQSWQDCCHQCGTKSSAHSCSWLYCPGPLPFRKCLELQCNLPVMLPAHYVTTGHMLEHARTCRGNAAVRRTCKQMLHFACHQCLPSYSTPVPMAWGTGASDRRHPRARVGQQ